MPPSLGGTLIVLGERDDHMMTMALADNSRSYLFSDPNSDKVHGHSLPMYNQVSCCKCDCLLSQL